MNEHEQNQYAVDYRHRAVKSNKTDIVFSLCAYLSAALLYIYPLVVDGVRFVPVMQFCALVALVIGIYISQRYSWCVYTYGVIPNENKNSGEVEGLYFVAYRTVGKRQTCLSKIDMHGLKKIIRCTHKEDHKDEISAYGSPNVYNFCATMCPAQYYRAVFEADGGIAVISFEPDMTLAHIMKALAPEVSGDFSDGSSNKKDGKDE